MHLPVLQAKTGAFLALPVVLLLGLGWLGSSLLDQEMESAKQLDAALARADREGEIARRALACAGNMRLYLRNGGGEAFERAKKALAAMARRLHEAGADDAQALNAVVAAYKKQAETAVALFRDAAARHVAFENTADAFLKTAGAALDAKRAAAPAAGERKKISALYKAGAALRAARLTARAEERPDLFQAALARFDAARMTQDKTTPEKNQAKHPAGNESGSQNGTMSAVRQSLDAWRAAAGRLERAWADLDAARKALALDEKSLLGLTEKAAASSMLAARKQSALLTDDLSGAGGWLLATAVMAGAFGLVWMVLGIVLLAGPVLRCSKFAAAMAAGKAQGRCEVVGNDEVGTLAEALNDINRRRDGGE